LGQRTLRCDAFNASFGIDTFRSNCPSDFLSRSVTAYSSHVRPEHGVAMAKVCSHENDENGQSSWLIAGHK